jgi:hypothetical protein
MIKTQLCPAVELEDKNWWVKELAVFLIVAVAGYWGAGMVLDIKRDQTLDLIVKKEKWTQELQAKEPAVEQFKGLRTEMDLLNRKISALRRITTSKIEKVRPLIALDQLQTLWIEGVWYLSAEYAQDGSLTLQGAANDSLLVGEFMLGMRESMSPDTTNDDVRTQLGFANVTIKSASYTDNGDPLFKDIKGCMMFELSARHLEKSMSSQSMAYVPPARSALARWQ